MPVKKKILYIITQSQPWGGAQRYVHDMATVLHRDGWETTVATGVPDVGVYCNTLLHERLQAAGVSIVTLKYLTRAIHPLNNIRAIFEIRNLCSKLKPDIVHLNSSMAGVTGAIGARLARVPRILYTVHGLVTKEPLPWYLKLTYWLTEWISGKFRDITICVSEDDRRTVIRQHIAPPARTITIPIGIDPAIPFLTREEARSHLSTVRVIHESSRQKTQWIGTIAGLYKTKGLDTLIEAAHNLSSSARTGVSPTEPISQSLSQNDGAPISARGLSERVPISKSGSGAVAYRNGTAGTQVPQKEIVRARMSFLLIGEGPERHALESQIQKYGLQSSVYLLGAIPDAARYLKAFDCFILPSVKEGMPYTILEALAAGVPIVATNVGGIPEILNSFISVPYQGTGHAPEEIKKTKENPHHTLVPPGDAQALAEAIKGMVTKERGGAPLSRTDNQQHFLPSMVTHTVNEYLRLHPRVR